MMKNFNKRLHCFFLLIILPHLVKASYNNTTSFEPCSVPTKTRNIFLAFFATAVLVIGIIGNALTIIIILFSRNLYSHVAYHFIVSMAAADLCISFMSTPIKVDMYTHNGSFCHGKLACKTILSADFALMTVSINHLFLIAIDRCFAISKPYFYAAHFTKTKAKIMIIFVWLYAVTWAVLGLFPYHPSSVSYSIVPMGEGIFCYTYKKYFHTISITFIYVVPTIISAFLYAIVLSIATKHAAAIEKMKPAAVKLAQPKKSKDTRALKMICIVFTAYTICWCPNFTITLLNYWHPKTMLNFAQKYTIAYDAVTTIFNNILPVLNSCINPFIYFITSTHFRVSFRDVVNRLLEKPRSNYMHTYESAVTNSVYTRNPTGRDYQAVYSGETDNAFSTTLTWNKKIILFIADYECNQRNKSHENKNIVMLRILWKREK